MSCKKCGKCCYLSVITDSKLNFIRTKRKCPFLGEDNLCTTYESRPSWCLTAEEMKLIPGGLPEGCGYGE